MLDLFSMESWLQTVLVALVAFICVNWFIQKRKYKLPPGPIAVPILGNLLQIKGKMLHEQVFNEWVPKYGPVVSIQYGPLHVVFVNNIDMSLEVLVTKSTNFANRGILPTFDMMSEGGKDIVLGQYGPTWRLQRKIATKALRRLMQGKALEERVHYVMQTTIVELVQQEGIIETNIYMHYITASMFTEFCFGERFCFDDKDAKNLMKISDRKNEALGEFIPEDIFPLLKYVYKSKTVRIVEEWIEAMYTNFIKKKFKEQEKTFVRNDMRHFCDYLIQARLEAEEEEGVVLHSLTESHLIQTLGDIYNAGTDSSRHTLEFTILFMIALPDIQAKVQEEIDRVVEHGRLPGLADRPNLSYTEAVLYESMRLKSATPTGVPHQASCDTTLGDYNLPKDTMVVVNHWALLNDPAVWPDYNKFIPERYLDKDGKLGKLPLNWLPFSDGKRGCPGEFVARPELHLIFACLMQRFKWKPEPGVVPDFESIGSMFGGVPKPHGVILEKRF